MRGKQATNWERIINIILLSFAKCILRKAASAASYKVYYSSSQYGAVQKGVKTTAVLTIWKEACVYSVSVYGV